MLGHNTSGRAQVAGSSLDFTWTPFYVHTNTDVPKIILAPDLPEHKHCIIRGVSLINLEGRGWKIS